MTDTTDAPQRCAECDCDGGVCTWISTDPSKDAPERLFISPQLAEELSGKYAGPSVCEPYVEYVRADLLTRARAEAYAEGREAASAIAQEKHDAAMKWASTYLKEFDGKTDSLAIAEEIRHLPNPYEAPIK